MCHNGMNEFPAAFLHWTSITSLQLSGFQLMGGIPESVKYLRSLKEVSMPRNWFHGTEIPAASIMELASLEVLLLNSCGLIGEVGLEFEAFLKTLKWYSLRKNKLKFLGQTKFEWVGRKALEENGMISGTYKLKELWLALRVQKTENFRKLEIRIARASFSHFLESSAEQLTKTDDTTGKQNPVARSKGLFDFSKNEMNSHFLTALLAVCQAMFARIMELQN
ncbi:hypothetical protein BJ741DRAFT_582643 [Chytriomyces cf. hyalinus JEL632]|nr:hypothetical protein BJ741DRAFT_582643 [Chytriomyces cf. hyalinus JEL632]